MRYRRIFLLALCAGMVLSWRVADRGRGPVAGLSESLQAIGTQRYLVHLSTDKQVYRVGEPVFVRGVILDALSGEPLPASENLRPAAVTVLGPRGERVAQLPGRIEHSTLAASWGVPDGQAGGAYRLEVRIPGLCAPAEREFEIRRYRPPRFKSQIVFLRKGYGPGETVDAALHCERAEGGVPADAAVEVVARVDGAEVHRSTTAIDAAGDARVRFELPAEIAVGEGSLAWIIADGGSRETAAKTIPILLRSLDVGVYPEGGDLVAGLANRVYLQANRPDGKPADLRGRIVAPDGAVLAAVATEHEGRGRVSFTPPAAAPAGGYRLVVDEPAGIEPVPLPAVAGEGVVLRALEDRGLVGRPLGVVVAATADRTVRLSIARKDQELACLELGLVAGEERPVRCLLPDKARGVLTATVRDAEGLPLAERLLLRLDRRRIDVAIEVPGRSLVPGETVELTVRTTDEEGRPVPAVVGLTVSDAAVRELLERRDHAPALPVMAWLENEVADLADAAVYFDPDNAAAARQCDLLLGTQGWRRFAFYRVEDFLAGAGDDARRVLAQAEPPPPPPPAALRLPMAGGGGGEEVDAAPPRLPEAEIRRDKAPDDDADEDPAGTRAEPAVAALVAGDLEELAPLEEARVADEDRVRVLSVVRIYAHRRRPDWRPGRRRDFTETLFWAAGIETDETGKATVAFDLNDAVGSFRVGADAFDARGALGASHAVLESRPAFAITPKLPLQLTAGDRPCIPLSLANHTSGPLAMENLVVDGDLPIADRAGLDIDRLPVGYSRVHVTADTAGMTPGRYRFRVDGAAGGHRDSVELPVAVYPRGFPMAINAGGMLRPGTSFEREITVPATLTPDSLRAEVMVFPTPLANLTSALERLIRDPYGCFEQTSATSYPLVMAQQYFRSHQGVDPALVARAQEKLDAAYQRLTSFECDEEGYEWFGQDPGHEALSAYGLMQFSDMAEFMPIDAGMLARTRTWLLSRRDGEGGYLRNQKALDSFGGAPQAVTDAYITWALAASGERGLDRELAALDAAAADSEDPYVIALAVLAREEAGGDADLAALRARLADLQTKAGDLRGTTTSITRSGGRALALEATALALLAWLPDERYAGNAQRAKRFIVESCEGGRFGSTQSTILALKAIVAHDAARAVPKAPGHLVLVVDGDPRGEPIAFDRRSRGTLSLAIDPALLGPGRHTIGVRMEDGAPMPCALAVEFHAERPDTVAGCPLRMTTGLSRERLPAGEGLELSLRIANRGEADVATPVAVLGIPGGCDVRHEALKELKAAGRIASYEVSGRNLVLYWRQLAAGEAIALDLPLTAAVAGSYTGPASRCYPYYTDELTAWNDALAIEIERAR